MLGDGAGVLDDGAGAGVVGSVVVEIALGVDVGADDVGADDVGTDEVAGAGVVEVTGAGVVEVAGVGVLVAANVRVTGEAPVPAGKPGMMTPAGTPVTSWPFTVAFTWMVPVPPITATAHVPVGSVTHDADGTRIAEPDTMEKSTWTPARGVTACVTKSTSTAANPIPLP